MTDYYEIISDSYNFTIDISNPKNAIVKADTLNTEKWVFKDVGDIQYVMVDNIQTGYHTTLVNVQEFIDFAAKAGENIVIKYDLGNVGETWYSGKYKVGQITSSILVPGDLAKEYYELNKQAGDFLGQSRNLSDVFSNTLVEMFRRSYYDKILCTTPAPKFYDFFRIVESEFDGTALSFSESSYLTAYDKRYYTVIGTNIGDFLVGQY